MEISTSHRMMSELISIRLLVKATFNLSHPQGPYSSTDPAVIDQHMKWMAESRIGVLCTSWWGRSASDSQLENVKGFTDNLVVQILGTNKTITTLILK